jgi:hypothetical protein
LGVDTPVLRILLQMLEFHGEAIDGNAVATAWLGALPLTADELEAAVAHEQLVRLVEASDPRYAPVCSVLAQHCSRNSLDALPEAGAGICCGMTAPRSSRSSHSAVEMQRHTPAISHSWASVAVSLHRILGEQNANLPRILGILAVVLARGTDLASEDTLRRMVTLLQHMRQGLPPQVQGTPHRNALELAVRCCAAVQHATHWGAFSVGRSFGTNVVESVCRALQVFQDLVNQLDQKQQATLQSVLAGQAPS